MELQRNHEEIKCQRQEGPPEKFDDAHAKLRINQCLHEIMPPQTTIAELDDFALAIYQTVRSAWLK